MNIESWAAKNFHKGDWAVVTGSTSGIGENYALEFAKLGFNLVCVSNEEATLENQKNIYESEYGIKVKNIAIDLSDSKTLISSLTEFPLERVKVLVNNAGIGMKGLFEKNSVEAYYNLISINVTAPVIILRHYIEHFQKQNQGLIITISSINSLLPIPKNQTYTATKAFLTNFAWAVSYENRKTDLVFQTVLPGTTKTPFHDKQGATPTHMTMLPEEVVRVSFSNLKNALCIPNKGDRFLKKIVQFLPVKTQMAIALYVLEKRLGM